MRITKQRSKRLIIVCSVVFGALLVPASCAALVSPMMFADPTAGHAERIPVYLVALMPFIIILSIVFAWVFYGRAKYTTATLLGLLPGFDVLAIVLWVVVAALFYDLSPNAPKITLTSSANPSAAGQPVTITAAVTCHGEPATGSLTFFEGPRSGSSSQMDNAGDLALSRGRVSITTSRLPSGNRSISAHYRANGKCRDQALSLNQVVNGAGASDIFVTLIQSTDGSQLKLQADVSCGNDPSGKVTFFDGQSPLPGGDAVGLSDKRASLSAGGLANGSHTITAAFSGDGNCAPSRSGSLTQVVNEAGSGTAPNTSGTGAGTVKVTSYQDIRVGFVIDVTCGGKPAAGNVALLDGGRPLGDDSADSRDLYNGHAVLNPTLAAGSHTVSVSYSGDGGCATSRSAPLSFIVNEPANSTLALTSSENPSSAGGYVTFTAIVSCDYEPAGSVSFVDGQSTLGDASVSQGQAGLSTAAITAGEHTITASYNGSPRCAPGGPTSLTQLVRP